MFIGGEQKRAVRVQADPGKLAAMGLTLEDVRGTLVNSTANAPKGTVDAEHRSFALYANDQLTKGSEYNNVILCVPQRRAGAGAATSAAPWTGRRTGCSPAGRTASAASSWSSSSSPAPTSSTRWTASRRRCRRCEAAIPPAIHVSVIMDRTLTIRASLHDVQFTLMLSISLVVMVIFVFLRSVWATIIPSITVPVALICTFAVMYLLNYSLDNLSLMALTIAVGFVVDDAIVMLENIHRHIEEGMKPMEAALKGAGEIGFTIVSISCSLIAVFIPLLLMGGIVGRLFREFAMTVTVAVVVSCVVSLTLTPMMCSRFLRHDTGRHGRLYRIVEGFFDGMIGGYRRTLDIALRHQFITLLTFLATLALTVVALHLHSEGLLPATGHRRGPGRDARARRTFRSRRCRASSGARRRGRAGP